MPDRSLVTRFAPSPTGYLHIGGARTALFNWAFARKHGGTFILRIEDTDKARSTPEATRRILSDLQWLGIDWDEGPDPDAPDPYDIASRHGEHGPYFQSQRDALYKQYLRKLLDMGRAYPDQGAYRFRMPEADVTVHDLVLGDVTIKRENLEDFVIVKSDGGPTFHFANVVDDATMGVTHVLRAQEHLMNTPKHVAMFDALGIPRPRYAHMPLIFNPDGSKMSKRDKAKAARAAVVSKLKTTPRHILIDDLVHDHEVVRQLTIPPGRPGSPEDFVAFIDKRTDAPDVVATTAHYLGLALPEIDVHDFRASGYLPGVLLNYIALLGWSPGGNVERFDLSWFKQNFTIEGIGKSNARFDREKLRAFNAETLQKLTPDGFRQHLRQFLRENVATSEYGQRFDQLADRPEFSLFAESYRPRSRTLDEPRQLGRFFVARDDAIEYDGKAVEKVLRRNDGAGLATLRELRGVLSSIDPWTPEAIHAALERFAADTTRGPRSMGDVAQPLRVAVSGSTVSPAIHDTLAILGQEATLRRIERCLALSV